MIYDRSYFFKNNLKIMKKNNKVILGNRQNGKWLKISRQCMDILEKGISENYSINMLLKCMEDESDREYFLRLFDKLEELDVITFIGKDIVKTERTVDFAITHRCNLKCIHCCVDADTVNGREYLTTEEIYTSLDKIILSQPTHIILTGGEAMIRKDFFDILQYLYKKYNGKIVLMTNGTLINQKNVFFLTKYLDAIDISIDGVDEKSCATIRGKGVFGKVLESIRLLQENNFSKISLSMVMTKENMALREQFLELNKKLGTKAVPRVFSPIGRGEINEEDLQPIFNYSNRTPAEIKDAKKYSENEILNNLRICHCGALNKTLYINYKGDIFPCALFEKENFILGNILEIESLKSFYEDKIYMKSMGFSSLLNIQPDRHSKCKDCDVNLFCWNCLHFLDLYQNSDKIMEARCKERKGELQEIIWR